MSMDKTVAGQGVPVPIAAVASSSSSPSVLVASSGSSLIVHTDSSTQTISSPSTSNPKSDEPSLLVRHIAISSDSSHIATASDDKFLRIYSLSSGQPNLKSTRSISKKCSDLAFLPSSSPSEPNILLSDKVGDVYLYPFTPRSITADRPTTLTLQSDPSLNPDAEYLLGHVSILTSTIITSCGKFIITSDRDEHIRVSRFPRSYVIERYIFGSDGFISAMHIPESSPEILITAGGEQWMRMWDWNTGKAVGKVDIYPAVLPYRRARSNLRRMKRPRGTVETKKEVTEEAKVPTRGDDESFYVAPEGFALPSGQGVCIKKIRTVKVGDETLVIFFSEGAAAIHSFLLNVDSETPPPISTLPLDSPVLDFTFLASTSSSPQILISLDSTWDILRHNSPPGARTPHASTSTVPPEAESSISRLLAVAEISESGFTLIPDHPTITSLQSEYTAAPASEVAKLQLYPLLPLLPRWAGMEEDDELAGPAAGEAAGPSGDAEGGDEKRTYTRDELSKMGNKMLGRLKSQGVDVEEFLKRKQRGPRGGAAAKKRRTQDKLDGQEGTAEVAGDEAGEAEDVDLEAQMNES